MNYADASAVMDEINRLTPSYGGILYPRIENIGLVWPCPAPDHPGTPVLHAKVSPREKARFLPLNTVLQRNCRMRNIRPC